MFKKINIIILIITLLFLISGCSLNFYYCVYIPPEYDDYKIIEFNFSYKEVNSNITFLDIEDDVSSNAIKANILITNLSYKSSCIFGDKDHWSGSGVIFYQNEKYYYALTNFHVVETHEDYKKSIYGVYDYNDKRYNGFIYEGSLNKEYDLAVIVFEKGLTDLMVLDVNENNPLIGSNIISISNPLDQRNIISLGKIIDYSKTKITDRYNNEKTIDFYSIVHNAEINSGSSGGMVLNYNLDIIGIHYASNRDEINPRGYAIPSDIISQYMLEQIINSP